MSFNLFHLNSHNNKTVKEKTFKQRKTFSTRKEEVIGIRIRFPNKIPVVVERYEKEKILPRLDKDKFLVPKDLPMVKFIAIIKNRMQLDPSYSFYLIINNQTLANVTKTMIEMYKEHKDDDGFLYISYASQEMFGC